jgi:diguanylate cyclase (GGDEF)-like protein
MTGQGRNPQTIIAEVGRAIASSLVLEEVLATVVQRVGQAMGAVSCHVLDYSPNDDLLTFRANWAVDDDPNLPGMIGKTFAPASRPSLVSVVRERRTVEVHVNDPELTSAQRDDLWGDLTTLDTPLVHAGELIGVLGLTDGRIRHYASDERELVEQLAALAAIAIYHARIFRRQEDQNRHLASLLEASRAVGSTIVLDEVIGLIARKAVEALNVRACAIYEAVVGGGSATLRASFERPLIAGDAGAASLADLPDLATDVGRVLESLDLHAEHGEAVAPAAHRRWSRSKQGGPRPFVRLTVPLLFGSEALGAMVLVDTRDEHEFTTVELELAGGLAEQASAGIQNARLYESLHQQAITDGLTGLYNHRFFYGRLNEEVARARRYGLPLSLLMIDIDDFKLFNDAHGHQMGDQALHSVAAILGTRLRQNIDIPARYGGEEFAVILPSTDAGGAVSVGSRLAGDVSALAAGGVALAPPSPARGGSVGEAAVVGERLRRSIELESATVGEIALPEPITVSIGVAQLADDGDVADLVAASDRALYAAKQRGKNRVCVGEPPLE